MLYRLKNAAQRMVFARRVAGILRTKPLTLSDDSPLHVLTQLQSKDVLMYLAAIKSFGVRVPIRAVFIVDDGSLTLEDRELLETHVPRLRWLVARDYQSDDLPKGGTWERLVAIAQLSQKNYIVQLDADTLSIGSLPEVMEAVRTKSAFTLGTWDGQSVEGVAERAVKAKEMLSLGHRHVQVMAEASFDRLLNAGALRYIRGCSGFAGFPPAPDRLDFIKQISKQMDRVLGAVWRQWGSEQVMSNLVVANEKRADVLPHPTYADCTKMRFPETRFVHFIGSCRFRGGDYADMVNRLPLPA